MCNRYRNQDQDYVQLARRQHFGRRACFKSQLVLTRGRRRFLGYFELGFVAPTGHSKPDALATMSPAGCPHVNGFKVDNWKQNLRVIYQCFVWSGSAETRKRKVIETMMIRKTTNDRRGKRVFRST